MCFVKKDLLFIVMIIVISFLKNRIVSFIHIVEMLLMLYNQPHLIELFTAQKSKDRHLYFSLRLGHASSTIWKEVYQC